MKEAVSIMKDVAETELTTPYWEDLKPAAILTIVYFSIVLWPNLCICCCSKNDRSNACLPRLVVISLIVEFTLSVAAMIQTFKAIGKLNDRNKLLKDLDKAVESCSDSYTDIPEDVVEEQID